MELACPARIGRGSGPGPVGVRPGKEGMGLLTPGRWPALRLKWRRPLITAGVILMLVGVSCWGLAAAGYIGRAAYAITIDGQLVGYVKSPQVMDQVVTFWANQASSTCGLESALCSRVETKKVRLVEARRGEGGARLLTGDELRVLLAGKLQFTAQAWAISVNGQSVVALKSEQEARQVVQDIKAEYSRPGPGSTLVDVRFLEGVTVEKMPVDPQRVRTPQEAKLILMRGTDKLLTYAVKRGDSLWRIAQAHGLSVEDLRKANPQATASDMLQPGQELTVVKAEPYVTVATVERKQVEIPIPRPVEVRYDRDRWPWEEMVEQEGQDGVKRLTYEIRREGGLEVSRTLISEEVLAEPVTRLVVKGSRQVPAMGKGILSWPVEGGGHVTSGFGWRRRDWHPAIDIAAPVGTAVRAADAGVVTTAGWEGGYGRLVVIDHGNGLTTRYGHLSTVNVRPGDRVDRGEKIGEVGVTGRTTGPHLHFEVRVGGQPQNPLKYYPGSGD